MTKLANHVTEDVLTWSAHGKTVTVHCFVSTAEAGVHISGLITGALSHAIDTRGQAVWIGCGGTTPRPIYQHLIYADLDWTRITLAQVDERFVPTDDAASNTRMMREALAPVLADKTQTGMEFLTLIQDMSDPKACAEKAEKTLRDLNDGAAPHFDFALMGMGPDSHYASIFPNNPVNAEVYSTERLVLPVAPHVDGSEPQLPRITLSVPAINNSRRIVFYITGQTKLDVLRTASQNTDPYASPIGAFIAQCPVDIDFVWAA
ncbi:6-phosphogluconolactonase [Asticcacaulis sp. 201]|uniref:6-phosphogluconolactonase n=1 Tax=Asticcacaulis sp. 201 TaxID=3028787 RepID=UPI002916FEDC|nr:6-phosphogluconolactonase [Asticcacaulis sp. 201]MDV6331931.1 6-phosphogluconolactonase [Asticcacaulis sp. 201]